jgi:hypothetical protein
VNTQEKIKNRLNTLLFIFVLANIVGEVGNIALWYGIPSLRASLQGGLIAKALGAGNALATGTTILSAIAIMYTVTLVSLRRKQKWAPILIIAISVANRAFALIIFEPVVPFYFAWTGILVFAALLDYWLLSRESKLQ